MGQHGSCQEVVVVTSDGWEHIEGHCKLSTKCGRDVEVVE